MQRIFVYWLKKDHIQVHRGEAALFCAYPLYCPGGAVANGSKGYYCHTLALSQQVCLAVRYGAELFAIV